MARTRTQLHTELLKILGNVYYQPPKNVEMKYPAIVYSLNGLDNKYGSNTKHIQLRNYKLTLIDKNPESGYMDALLKLPFCSFDRSYPSDGFNHFVFNLYF